MNILVAHGVNLNMFGRRDPKIYGHATLTQINEQLSSLAEELPCFLECFQTNDECKMIERMHSLLDEDVDAVVINAGAWTHTSLALQDCLALLSIPIVEVHMSNIHAREEIRRHSFITPVASGIIAGFGVHSYLLGLRAAFALAKERKKSQKTLHDNAKTYLI